MGIQEQITTSWRRQNNIPDSDSFEGYSQGLPVDKRNRSNTASTVNSNKHDSIRHKPGYIKEYIQEQIAFYDCCVREIIKFYDIFVRGCGTKIGVAAQPLPTGYPGGPEFTENSNACPLITIDQKL